MQRSLATRLPGKSHRGAPEKKATRGQIREQWTDGEAAMDTPVGSFGQDGGMGDRDVLSKIQRLRATPGS